MSIYLNLLGAAICLYVFMADAIHMLPQGLDAVRKVLPVKFNWILFLIGLVFMAAPVVELIVRVVRSQKK